MNTLKRLIFLQLLSMFFVACSIENIQQPTSPLWNDLRAGDYNVGFKIHYVVDDSRSFFLSDTSTTKDMNRLIRIMVWYPGVFSSSTKPLRFSDYIRVEPSNKKFTQYNAVLKKRDLDTARRQFSQTEGDSLFGVLMTTQTVAYRDLSPATGSFPLILHSLGRNNFQQESTVLWEYLASHGYVVAVVPQFGPNLENNRLAFTVEDLDIQLQDMEFALAELIKFPSVDVTRIAVMGHSSGGVIALLLAGKNSNVDAIVSLDGSISTTDGRDLLKSFDWDSQKMCTSILNLYAAGKRKLDLSVLDGLRCSDRYHVAIKNATHFDFQNWPLYSVLTNNADPRGAYFRSSETGRDIYISVVQITKHFLDAVFKENTQAFEYLRGETPVPIVPTDLIELRFQQSDN